MLRCSAQLNRLMRFDLRTNVFAFQLTVRSALLGVVEVGPFFIQMQMYDRSYLPVTGYGHITQLTVDASSAVVLAIEGDAGVAEGAWDRRLVEVRGGGIRNCSEFASQNCSCVFVRDAREHSSRLWVDPAGRAWCEAATCPPWDSTCLGLWNVSVILPGVAPRLFTYRVYGGAVQAVVGGEGVEDDGKVTMQGVVLRVVDMVGGAVNSYVGTAAVISGGEPCGAPIALVAGAVYFGVGDVPHPRRRLRHRRGRAGPSPIPTRPPKWRGSSRRLWTTAIWWAATRR